MKKKLSSNQKKLKALLAPKGALTILQDEVQKIFEGHGHKDKVFVPLERLLIAVSKFQDKHHKIMDNLKLSLKKDEDIMVYFGPLHVHIKACGRDLRKSEKHKSFVKNKAGILKKNSISGKVTYEAVEETKIFLGNDYYDSAQRLSFVKQQQLEPSSPLNEVMVKELLVTVENFLEENYNKISVNITELRELLN